MNKVTTNIIILFIVLLCSSCSNEYKVFAEFGVVVAKYNSVVDEFYVVMLTIPYCKIKTVEVPKNCYEAIKIGEIKILNEKENPEMPMQRE